MTYKIEITAETVAELAGRVLAMAAQFQTTGTTSVKIDPVMLEVKQAAVGELTPGRKNAPTAEASESQPETIPTRADTSPATASPELGVASAEAPLTDATSATDVQSAPTASSPSDAPAVDYKTDIVPRVLEVVQTKGRDAMEEILTQFGVSRAPHVPVELLPEFMAALDEVLTR